MNDMTASAALMSMTGFAATEGAIEGWSWTMDIRGVNGRSLDLRVRAPDVDGIESAFRKRLQATLGRGNVTLSLKLQKSDGAQTATLNRDALHHVLGLLGEIEAAAAANGLTVAPSRASDIAGLRGVLDYAEEASETGTNTLRAALLDSFETCLAAFLADRAREGAALKEIVSAQIDRIAALTEAAGQAAAARDADQKEALARALERLLSAADLPDEARLAQELALLAVKTDVTEEIDRLGAHVIAARNLLQTPGPVGRKLDFLMQEFNREANTLCSKAQSSALTAIALDLKTVIDQMREQVQNIE